MADPLNILHTVGFEALYQLCAVKSNLINLWMLKD